MENKSSFKPLKFTIYLIVIVGIGIFVYAHRDSLVKYNDELNQVNGVTKQDVQKATNPPSSKEQTAFMNSLKSSDYDLQNLSDPKDVQKAINYATYDLNKNFAFDVYVSGKGYAQQHLVFQDLVVPPTQGANGSIFPCINLGKGKYKILANFQMIPVPVPIPSKYKVKQSTLTAINTFVGKVKPPFDPTQGQVLTSWFITKFANGSFVYTDNDAFKNEFIKGIGSSIFALFYSNNTITESDINLKSDKNSNGSEHVDVKFSGIDHELTMDIFIDIPNKVVDIINLSMK